MSEHRTCDWCGRRLRAGAHEDAVTCSDAHRAARHRWLNAIPRAGGLPPQEPPADSPIHDRHPTHCRGCGAGPDASHTQLCPVYATQLEAARRQPRARKPSDVRVTFARLVEALGRDQALALLTPAQRARIDQGAERRHG